MEDRSSTYLMKLKENTVIIMYNRDIRKVRKRQHKAIHRVRFKENLQKYMSIQGGRGGVVQLRKPSMLMILEFHPVFLLS
jgi:hypothetical protein